MYENLSCPHKYDHLPHTLTFDSDIQTSHLCLTDSHHWNNPNGQRKNQNCSKQALAMVQKELEDVDQKECSLKEYGIRTMDEISLKTAWSETGFRIQFMVPESSMAWSNKFTKIVHREYLQISSITLVGTVGGTLGLFVGISFLEFGSCILAFGKKMVLTLNRGIHPHA